MIYDVAECVVLTNGRSPCGELLNMTAGFPIHWDNRVWKSSEALYQAARFPDNEKLQEEIRKASNGFAAKQIAKEHKNETRDRWENGINIAAMRHVLGLKCTQHEKIRDILAGTGRRDIVEFSVRDGFWGAKPAGPGTLDGLNVLGKLWMNIRTGIPLTPGNDYLPGVTISRFFA